MGFLFFQLTDDTNVFMGLISNTSQKSRLSKTRSNELRDRGSTRTPLSLINSRTHCDCPITVSDPDPSSQLPSSHDDARSHQSYTRPSVSNQRWPEAVEKLWWTARMARATSSPWIKWIPPYHNSDTNSGQSYLPLRTLTLRESASFVGATRLTQFRGCRCLPHSPLRLSTVVHVFGDNFRSSDSACARTFDSLNGLCLSHQIGLGPDFRVWSPCIKYYLEERNTVASMPSLSISLSIRVG